MAEMTFEPVRDVSLNIKAPTTNYNAAQLSLGKLWGGGVKSELYRTLIEFDVSALAGQTVETARLVREIIAGYGAGGDAAQLHRLTRPGTWVESEATWNNYKTGTPWTAAGGDYDLSVPAPVFWNEPVDEGSHTITGLKGFVDDALALRSGICSLLLRLANESDTTFDGKTVALHREHPFPLGRPNLIVEYGPSGEGAEPAERRYTDVLPAHGEARPARGASAVAESGGARPVVPRGPALPSSPDKIGASTGGNV